MDCGFEKFAAEFGGVGPKFREFLSPGSLKEGGGAAKYRGSDIRISETRLISTFLFISAS